MSETKKQTENKQPTPKSNDQASKAAPATRAKKSQPTLPAMTEKWMKLERKTLKQRQAAEQFYEKNLMKLIEQDFIKRNAEQVYEHAEYLIMSVGTSYEPIALNICLLQPDKILFLCTEKTEKYMDKVVAYCSLTASKFQKAIVSETNPIDIYHEIKQAYKSWGQPDKLYIDFTGGTKAMSAAAAMAGAMINVQLVYVGTNDYLPDFRKPNPGSETLYYITNPLEVFGDLEIEKAFTLFEKHNYSGARARLEELKEEVPDPDIRQQMEFAYLLSCVYEAWDALEFNEAYHHIVKLNKQLKRDRYTHGQFLLMDFADRLKQQENILEPLAAMKGLIEQKKYAYIMSQHQYMTPLMFTMYQNARIREEQEKLDMATLLLYRLLEMIEQSRLSNYNLYVSKMDYMNIAIDEKKHPEWKEYDSKQMFDHVKRNYFEIKKQLFGKTISSYMPEQISLLDGFVVLLALGDDICMQSNGRHIDKLKRIRSMVYLRNNSIFAHGLGPVGNVDFQKFKQFVSELFQEYCHLEGISFEEYLTNITWMNPFQSIYYSGMEEK